MVVGVCRLRLLFSGAQSLKDKRQQLRRLKDRVHHKFNAAIAEVADQDLWQSGVVGFAVVGNESRHVQSMVDKIVAFVEELYVAEIIDQEQEIVAYGDDEDLSARSAFDEGWEKMR